MLCRYVLAVLALYDTAPDASAAVQLHDVAAIEAYVAPGTHVLALSLVISDERVRAALTGENSVSKVEALDALAGCEFLRRSFPMTELMQAVANSLLNNRAEDVRKAALKLIQIAFPGRDATAASALARALSRTTTLESIQALDHLAEESNAEALVALAATFQVCSKQVRWPALELVRRLAKKGERHDAAHAVLLNVIARFPMAPYPNPRIMGMTVVTFRDDPEPFLQALLCIAGHGDDLTLTALLHLYHTGGHQGRALAVKALGIFADRGDARVEAVIAESLEGSSGQLLVLAANAAETLLEDGTDKAIAALSNGLRRTSGPAPEVIKAIAQRMPRADARVGAALCKYIGDYADLQTAGETPTLIALRTAAQLLCEPRSVEQREACVRACVRLVRTLRKERAGQDNSLVLSTFEALACRGEPAVFTELVELFDHSSASVRSVAAKAYRQAAAPGGDEAALDALAAGLEHFFGWARAATLEALGHVARRGDEHAVELLIPHLADANANVACAAMGALGAAAERGNARAISLAIAGLGSREPWVREAAAATLAMVAEPGDARATSALLPCLSSDIGSDMVLVALRALVTLSSGVEVVAADVAAVAVTLLCHIDNEVRRAAAEALPRLVRAGDVGAIAALQECVDDWAEENLVRQACEKAAKALGGGKP
eukprot:NODE_2301_length_2243_cov_7.772212.p1 GENE.NODE_2301_length_2243_cov_7.772212~~NODE_2301_length_2243_cov_7.772212.p1  ORF type:complete len:716 (+),score=223.40 NODE_2301_length_2243_cov_7.772212:149-2149(+)